MDDFKIEGHADLTVRPTVPDVPLRIVGDDGRTLLAIHPDGSVTGAVKDAGEAARVFVRNVEDLLRTGGYRP